MIYLIIYTVIGIAVATYLIIDDYKNYQVINSNFERSYTFIVLALLWPITLFYLLKECHDRR